MPKLLRIHFCGFGHPNARLHPLTLDLRGPDGLPTDSAVLLRNAGGKTSVISLSYAAVLPHKRDFLGKVNNTNRAFIEYLLGKNKLALAIMEFCREGDLTQTFAIIRASVLKERDDEESIFFCFRTNPGGIPFESLPVTGLRGSPTVSSVKALREWLWAQHHERPATVDLIESTGYGHWTSKLRDRGIDPQLFRTHLQMNRAEGAADEVFSFSTSAKFLEFFFGMVIDPPRTDENENDPIVRSIDEMRRSVQDMPKLKASLRFTERILPPMRDLVAVAEAYEKAKSEAAQLRTEAAAFRAAVDAKLAVLNNQRQSEQAALAELDGRLTKLAKDHERVKGYVVSYDHWVRRLEYEECVSKLEEARRQMTTAEGVSQTFNAANEWLAVEEIQHRVDELRGQIDRLRTAHRPEFLEVCRAAWATWNTYDLKIKEVDEQRTKAANSAGEASAAVTTETTNLNNAEKAQVKSQETFNNLARIITAAEQERRRLREEEGIIDAHETPEAARQRWAEQKQSHENRIQELKANTIDIQRQRTELAGQIRTLSEGLAALEKKEIKDQGELDRYEQARRRCETDERVRLVIGESPLNPHNPAVVEQLESDAHAADGQKERLVVLNAENERTLKLHNPADQMSLLPPPAEIENLVSRLHMEGIRTAQAGYRWLSNAFTGPERLSIIERFPEVAAGVVVQSLEDLAKARDIAEAAVSRPVFIGFTGTLAAATGLGRGFLAVLPEEHGFFDPQAARLARPGIESAVGLNKNSIRDFERERDSCRAAAQAVKALAAEFSMERLRTLAESVTSLREQIESKSAEVAMITQKRETLAAQINRNNDLQEEELRLSRRAEAAERELRTFIRDHWEKYSENVRKKNEEGEAINRRKVEVDDLRRKIDDLRTDQETFAKLATSLRDDVLRLQTERKERLSVEYLRVEEKHSDIADSMAGALAKYQSLRGTYEGKVQRGELEGQLTEATNQATNAENVFRRKYPTIDLVKVKALSVRFDLETETTRAKSEVDARRVDVSQATVNLQRATKRRPEATPHHERLSLPPGAAEPRTSNEAEDEKAKQEAQQSAIEQDLNRERGVRDARKEDFDRTKTAISDYNTIAEVLQVVADEARTVSPSTLVDAPPRDRERATGLRNILASAQKTRDGLASRRDKMAESALEVLNAPEFLKFEIEAQRKLASQGIDSLRRPAKEWVSQIEDLAAACENKMTELQRVHDALLDVLDRQAREAETRLQEAHALSRLPVSQRLGEWSGHHFLRTTITWERDPKVRREKLAALIDSWTKVNAEGRPVETTIPSGAKLAYKCFMALYDPDERGLVKIQILKPEIVLRLQYKNVESLATFSGGERVTAAIILYCIAVRVRSKSESLNLDCGYLMLDNPLAKANHSKLLNMQRMMAQELGVQLIYFTGINDRDALNEFPHHIRLRNNRLDPKTGHMFLEAVADNTPIIQAAVLGLDENRKLQDATA